MAPEDEPSDLWDIKGPIGDLMELPLAFAVGTACVLKQIQDLVAEETSELAGGDDDDDRTDEHGLRGCLTKPDELQYLSTSPIVRGHL